MKTKNYIDVDLSRSEADEIYGEKIEAKPVKIIWQKSLSLHLYYAPVFFQGNIYVGIESLDKGESSGTKYVFTSIDSASGENIWELNLRSSEFQSKALLRDEIIEGGGILENKPVVTEERVYSVLTNGVACCLERKTGRLIWNFHSGECTHGAITLYNGVLCFGSNNGTLFAVNAFNGSALWKSEVVKKEVVEEAYRYITARPVFWKGKILFETTGRKVYCFNAEDGRLEWKVGIFYTIKEHDINPIVYRDVMYTPQIAGWLTGLDLNCRGKITWIVWDDEHEGTLTTPLIYNNVLYYGSDGKIIEAYPVASEETFFPDSFFTLYTEDEVEFEPVEDNGWIYFVSGKYIYAIEAVDIQKEPIPPFRIKKFSLPALPTGPLEVKSGKLWVGLEDRTLICAEFK